MIAADDLYAAQGETILAFDTVYIYLNGSWFELHLTQGNIARYEDALQPYLDVARPSKGPAGEQRHAGKTGKPHPRGTDRRDWSGFKAWCDSAGRSYRNSSGGFYAKVQDVKDYEQWIAEHPANAPAGSGPGDKADGRRSAA